MLKHHTPVGMFSSLYAKNQNERVSQNVHEIKHRLLENKSTQSGT